MKSLPKLLAIAAFAVSFGASFAAKANICFTPSYPTQHNIDSREVMPTLTINTPSAYATEIYTVVYFDHSSVKLSGKEELKLKDVAAVLKSSAYRGTHVAVRGYTDSSGKDATNQRLSYHRAVTVMHTLVQKYHVPAAMLSAQGFGKEGPVGDNKTASGRALNRRVTFAVIE